jgi:hypothetical protein
MPTFFMSTFTIFSWRKLTSFTLKVLRRVMLEMVDMGSTVKSSITIYVTTPLTYPVSFGSTTGLLLEAEVAELPTTKKVEELKLELIG